MGITAGTVPLFVLLPVRHVDTQMDCVLVKQDGRVQNVLTVKEVCKNFLIFCVAMLSPVTFAQEKAKCTLVLDINEMCFVNASTFHTFSSSNYAITMNYR